LFTESKLTCTATNALLRHKLEREFGKKLLIASILKKIKTKQRPEKITGGYRGLA
jgi:hypothetical protein